MPLHDAHAFVLRTYDFAEADKVCVLMTRHAGKIRAVAYGARKTRSRFGASLEPLTEILITYHERAGRELLSISHTEIVHSYFDASTASVEASAAVSYFADLLCEFLPEHEPDETTYRLVAATMSALASHADITALVRYFEVWMLRLAGFFPDLSRCGGCGGIQQLRLGTDGVPRCPKCATGPGQPLSPAPAAIVRRILGESPAKFAGDPPDVADLDQLGEICYQVTRHALEREPRSYSLFNRLRREAALGAMNHYES
jgi:DNA repair protein RecO (recombination protein O)